MSVGLDALRDASSLSLLDCEFGERLLARAGATEPLVALAAALTRREAADGHICLDLRDDAVLEARFRELDATLRPSAAEMREALERSTLVEWVASHDQGGETAGDVRPLVLDASGRLYLRRYWSYQTRLAHALSKRASAELARVDMDALRAGLDRTFPNVTDPRTLHATGGPPQASFDFMSEATDGGEPIQIPAPATLDRQRLAAAVASLRRLTVISGGPGTGKTATVVKILALAIEQALVVDPDAAPRIRLVAPTGKAAATLANSVRNGIERLDLAEPIREALPVEAVTIHRALGVRSGARFGVRHDANHPLEVDILVVDEASMVDLALMTRLFDAIPDEARVILLGDEHQLASVEAGAVMGDVCRAATPEGFPEDFADTLESLVNAPVPRAVEAAERSALQGNVVRLTRSYRYASDRGIGALARAINDGDASAVLDILSAADQAEVQLHGPLHEARADHEAFRQLVVEGYRPYLETEDPLAMLEAFSAFRVLSPVRAGRSGVQGLGNEIEYELRSTGWLEGPPGDPLRRPVLVTENDHAQGLFNGDIGFFVESDRAEEALTSGTRVVFPDAGGSLSGETAPLRWFSPSRLPAFEPAWAMTIHKSQGSEFRHVAVVIPEAAAEHVTRQQLYTAITRARERVSLFASPNAIAQAVERDTKRSSGLGDALCADLHAL